MGEENPWASVVGPCYTTESFRRMVGASEADLHRAVAQLRVLRLVTPEAVDLYPAFQLKDDKPVPGLEAVLTVLKAGVDDPWTWAQFLNTEGTVDGVRQERMICRLARGEVDQVVQIARQAAAVWAS